MFFNFLQKTFMPSVACGVASAVIKIKQNIVLSVSCGLICFAGDSVAVAKSSKEFGRESGREHNNKVITSQISQEKSGNIRIGLHEGFTRFVIETENDENISVQTSQNKMKIIIKNEKIAYFNIRDNSKAKSPFNEISSSIKSDGSTIIEASLKSGARILNNFEIKKSAKQGYRYIIDFAMPQTTTKLDTISNIIKITESSRNIKQSDPSFSEIVIDEALNEEDETIDDETQIQPSKIKRLRNTTSVAIKNSRPVIVIDAGHGGSDQGASGKRYNTKEKDITIRYALLTYAKLKKLGKYDVRLTRTGDYTMNLKTRRDLAAKYNADLFISIHADHHPNSKTTGMSIYTLSATSSDEVAEKLAESHEEGQIIGGIKFNEKDGALSKIFVDLERRKSLAESVCFAELMVGQMKKNKVSMLFNTHRFAGFAVLKGPDVPSVLVELGFLSNKREEALLRSTKHKQTVTSSIVASIDKYFQTKK